MLLITNLMPKNYFLHIKFIYMSRFRKGMKVHPFVASNLKSSGTTPQYLATRFHQIIVTSL